MCAFFFNKEKIKTVFILYKFLVVVRGSHFSWFLDDFTEAFPFLGTWLQRTAKLLPQEKDGDTSGSDSVRSPGSTESGNQLWGAKGPKSLFQVAQVRAPLEIAHLTSCFKLWKLLRAAPAELWVSKMQSSSSLWASVLVFDHPHGLKCSVLWNGKLKPCIPKGSHLPMWLHSGSLQGDVQSGGQCQAATTSIWLAQPLQNLMYMENHSKNLGSGQFYFWCSDIFSDWLWLFKESRMKTHSEEVGAGLGPS